MPQPRPALQRLSAPASLHNGDRESEFKGFKGVKWLKINLTRQLKHVLAFSCLWQLVQVYFRRFWGDLSAEKGLSTGFWSALQRRVSSSASLRLALERHSAIQRLPFACTAAPSVRPAARSAALFASASCTLCIVAARLGCGGSCEQRIHTVLNPTVFFQSDPHVSSISPPNIQKNIVGLLGI